MDVGFIWIQRPADGWDDGAVPGKPNTREHVEISDEVAGEVGVVTEGRDCARREIRVTIKAVLLLVGATVLRLQDQARAKGMDPARSEILARVVGDIRNSRQAAGGRRVVVNGAVAEPEEVLCA